MVCTFFGHADTPKSIEPMIKSTLINLIENENVTTFYVGNNENFDTMVKSNLEQLSDEYNIEYNIVLAYLPKVKRKKEEIYINTIYPEGLEKVPARFAICHRNKWMITQSDIVVTYVTHPSSGAAQFKTLAESKNKRVINLAVLK